jgi:succinyl-CoA synthetase alpha subunit
MSILVGAETCVIIQGATGRQGSYHTERMLEYGVKVVGGVTPGKGGRMIHGVPVFDTVRQARDASQVDATMILVPPAGVLDAALEAIDHRIPLVVIITEFVPVHDSLVIKRNADRQGVRVIGPNTVGVISPGKGKVGIMPGDIYSEGRVGVISRSGTLTHEIASNMTYRGIGQSTCVCIGGDPIKGTSFADMLELFRADEQTAQVVIIGEIGGADEEMTATYLKGNPYPKPIYAFIAGRRAPAEKKMGHAGAIVSRGFGTAESKIRRLTEAEVRVVSTPDEILDHVADE